MDKFEQSMTRLENMSAKDKAAEIDNLKSDCICGDCPSYTDCAREKEELLYCALTRSEECISEEVDCICPSCPVVNALGLSSVYYCTRGNEVDQRKVR